jgi:hypothetical protein
MTYEQQLKRLGQIAKAASKVKQERKQAKAREYQLKRQQLEDRGLL